MSKKENKTDVVICPKCNKLIYVPSLVAVGKDIGWNEALQEAIDILKVKSIDSSYKCHITNSDLIKTGIRESIKELEMLRKK